MKLPFFGHRFVNRLREAADANRDKYGATVQWIEDFAGGELYFRESNQVVGPPPALLSTDEKGTHPDAENARLVYGWLRSLTPALAMEERLWAYMTHCMFPEYMHDRWPIAKVSVIHRRYLFEGSSFAALSRNGIARLWWAGYLTEDTKRENPFELTDTLFLRQDIHVALMERSIGKCRTVRTGVLEFLKKNLDYMSREAFGRRIQLLVRELNLLGGVSVLDALPPATLEAALTRISTGFEE